MEILFQNEVALISLPTIKWFQVLWPNIPGLKLDHQMQFRVIPRTLDGIPTATTTQGQSETGSNGNEGILHIT